MSMLLQVCKIVELAVAGITEDWATEPMHLNIKHLEGMSEHLKTCYDMKLNPTEQETEAYELASASIVVALEMHTDHNYPCCRG